MSEYNFFFTILKIILGIIMLSIGAKISLSIKIPSIMALITSLPELFVSLSSIINGSDSLLFGNVVNSNIFNILVVLGISSIINPIKINKENNFDIKILLIISSILWGSSSKGLLTIQYGLSSLFIFILLIIYRLKGFISYFKQFNIIKIVLTSLFLSFGSNILVNGSQTLATLFGINEAIIGLTIVVTGTSLPDLFSGIAFSISKNYYSYVLEGVIWSNILNILLILGSCTLLLGFKGLVVNQSIIKVDIPFMIYTVVLLLFYMFKGEINRLDGIYLIITYLIYIIDKILFLKDSNSVYEFRIFSFIILAILFLITIVYPIYHKIYVLI